MTSPTPSPEEIEFYPYHQAIALSTFPSILESHLPHSNPLYGRIRSPQNTPERCCLLAASFMPPTPTSPLPEVFTVVFADRSRYEESQMWIYNSLIRERELSESQHAQLTAHTKSAIHFIKETAIPSAPGWPFQPTLRLGCIHETITSVLLSLFPKAIPYISRWNLWILPTKQPSDNAEAQKPRRELPPGYKISRVPVDQIGKVISTSSIARQAATLCAQANTCVLDPEGEAVAWGYIGIDGSLATLYVVPEERGKGLATVVARKLLEGLGEGAFRDLGVGGGEWVHADVKVGNVESEGVMRGLGGTVGWTSTYVRIELEKI